MTRARPVDAAHFYQFFDNASCTNRESSPCWLGIRVGETRRAEALTLLRDHPWIGDIHQTETVLSWRWSGEQPAAINDAQAGLIGLLGDYVYRIRIQTRLPYGEVWVILGAPTDALLVSPVSRSQAYQLLEYEGLSARVIGDLSCPVTPTSLWSSPIVLGMGNLWQTEGINAVSFSIYHHTGWWRNLRYCRPYSGS